MANIKISELNELTQKAYDDYIPVVDSSANETKKISVEKLIPSNVSLIAVTDTAPSTYETGDKYYNTETGKIYTATGSGWANAEDPISDILYIVLSEQKSYTYDGTDLISVGGGAGGSVTVAPDEPTEDTKLYIESEDLDFQGEIVDDIYSTSEIKTNKIWINGKSIYRKVLNITSFSSQNTQVNHGITNLDEVINIYGAAKLDNGRWQPIPRVVTDAISSYGIGIGDITSTQVLLQIPTDYTTRTKAYLILEYTKSN